MRAVEACGCADGVHPAAAVPLMLYRLVGRLHEVPAGAELWRAGFFGANGGRRTIAECWQITPHCEPLCRTESLYRDPRGWCIYQACVLVLCVAEARECESNGAVRY